MFQWLQAVEDFEICINAAMSLLAPHLFRGALRAMTNVQENPMDYFKEEMNPAGIRSCQAWPSVFNGITVITNRNTPSHRDGKGHGPWFDLLYSGGYHTRAKFSIPELRANFTYQPGTVIALCGRVFRHEVMEWSGKDRLCLAHYMRHEIQDRLQEQVSDAPWVEIHKYLQLCDEEFTERHWKGFRAQNPNLNPLLQ